MSVDDFKQPTKLSVSNYGNTVTWETLHSDVSIEEMINAFYTLCIGITFVPSTVLQGMKDFVESKLEEEIKDE